MIAIFKNLILRMSNNYSIIIPQMSIIFYFCRMPYVQAIVLESLRMFMGRTLNVPHRALRDTSIIGHKIPKVSLKL
jgi:hypothetical protein